MCAGPYCLRVQLTLEEKNAQYTAHLVDLQNKPAWLLDVNSAGTGVPLMCCWRYIAFPGANKQLGRSACVEAACDGD